MMWQKLCPNFDIQTRSWTKHELGPEHATALLYCFLLLLKIQWKAIKFRRRMF